MIKTRRIKLILVIVVILFTSIAASVVVIHYYPGTLGSQTGSFDSSWSKYISSSLPSWATITSTGVLAEEVDNTEKSFSGAYWATDSYPGGSPNWLTSPAVGGKPSLNVTTITITVTYTKQAFISPTNRANIYLGLYFQFPNCLTATAGASTGKCYNQIDGQIIISSCLNSHPLPTFGTPYTSELGSRFGARQFIGTNLAPGQTLGPTRVNITSFYTQALSQLGLPSSTPMSLFAIELGTEGYGANFSANWTHISI